MSVDSTRHQHHWGRGHRTWPTALPRWAARSKSSPGQVTIVRARIPVPARWELGDGKIDRTLESLLSWSARPCRRCGGARCQRFANQRSVGGCPARRKDQFPTILLLNRVRYASRLRHGGQIRSDAAVSPSPFFQHLLGTSRKGARQLSHPLRTGNPPMLPRCSASAPKPPSNGNRQAHDRAAGSPEGWPKGGNNGQDRS